MNEVLYKSGREKMSDRFQSLKRNHEQFLLSCKEIEKEDPDNEKSKYEFIQEKSALKSEYFGYLVYVEDRKQDFMPTFLFRDTAIDWGKNKRTSPHRTKIKSLKIWLDQNLEKDKQEIENVLSNINQKLADEKSLLSIVGSKFKNAPSVQPETQYDGRSGGKLFLQRWGREAEDALIFQLLRHVEKCKNIPTKIEIYGTLDPCFQCQIKLQWMADLLGGELKIARGNRKIKFYQNGLIKEKHGQEVQIHYFSKKGIETNCVIDKLPSNVVRTDSYTTRMASEKGKLKKFYFSSKKLAAERELEIFNIFDINLDDPGRLSPEIMANIITEKKRSIKVHLKNLDLSDKQKKRSCQEYVEKIFDAAVKNEIEVEFSASFASKKNKKEKEKSIDSVFGKDKNTLIIKLCQTEFGKKEGSIQQVS